MENVKRSHLFYSSWIRIDPKALSFKHGNRNLAQRACFACGLCHGGTKQSCRGSDPQHNVGSPCCLGHPINTGRPSLQATIAPGGVPHASGRAPVAKAPRSTAAAHVSTGGAPKTSVPPSLKPEVLESRTGVAPSPRCRLPSLPPPPPPPQPIVQLRRPGPAQSWPGLETPNLLPRAPQPTLGRWLPWQRWAGRRLRTDPSTQERNSREVRPGRKSE
jgi:hypothetical protein